MDQLINLGVGIYSYVADLKDGLEEGYLEWEESVLDNYQDIGLRKYVVEIKDELVAEFLEWEEAASESYFQLEEKIWDNYVGTDLSLTKFKPLILATKEDLDEMVVETDFGKIMDRLDNNMLFEYHFSCPLYTLDQVRLLRAKLNDVGIKNEYDEINMVLDISR